MANHLSLAAFVCVALIFQTANAVFLHMAYSEQKCFYEEIPEDTLIMVKYKMEAIDPMITTEEDNRSLAISSTAPAASLGVNVTVRDPNGQVVMSKNYGREGRIAFTSHMAGDHVICLSSNDTYSNGFLRVHVNMKVGGHAIDYDVVEKKEKLTAVQLKLRKVQDLTDQIRKEQNYQRAREKRFRETSESTNRRVLVFALIQTLVLMGVAFYQIRHLKSFFIMKKLV